MNEALSCRSLCLFNQSNKLQPKRTLWEHNQVLLKFRLLAEKGLFKVGFFLQGVDSLDIVGIAPFLSGVTLPFLPPVFYVVQ